MFLFKQNAFLSVKVLVFASLLLAAGIANPLGNCVCSALIVGIIAIQDDLSKLIKPIIGICIFGSLVVLIALPFHQEGDIAKAAEISSDVMLVMFASLWFVKNISDGEAASVLKKVKVPDDLIVVLIGSRRFISSCIFGFHEVLLAQKSRGLRLKYRYLFSVKLYEALVVPYVMYVLRSVDSVFVSVSIRHRPKHSVSERTVVGMVTVNFILLFMGSAPWLFGMVFATLGM